MHDSGGGFPTFPSSTAIGPASPTSVPIHDVLDHWVCGFGWRTYSDEAKATVMHGLRNGIDVRKSFELLAEDLIADQNPLEPIELFNLYRGLLLGGALNPSREAFNRVICQMGHEKAIASTSMSLHRIGLEGIHEAQRQWQKLGLNLSLMGHIGLALQELLKEAESIIVANKHDFIDATLGIQISNCTIEVAEVGYQNSRQY